MPLRKIQITIVKQFYNLGNVLKIKFRFVLQFFFKLFCSDQLLLNSCELTVINFKTLESLHTIMKMDHRRAKNSIRSFKYMQFQTFVTNINLLLSSSFRFFNRKD